MEAARPDAAPVPPGPRSSLACLQSEGPLPIAPGSLSDWPSIFADLASIGGQPPQRRTVLDGRSGKVRGAATPPRVGVGRLGHLGEQSRARTPGRLFGASRRTAAQSSSAAARATLTVVGRAWIFAPASAGGQAGPGRSRLHGRLRRKPRRSPAVPVIVGLGCGCRPAWPAASGRSPRPRRPAHAPARTSAVVTRPRAGHPGRPRPADPRPHGPRRGRFAHLAQIVVGPLGFGVQARPRPRHRLTTHVATIRSCRCRAR